MWARENLAWVAGIIEGEGTLNPGSRGADSKYRPQWSLRVAMTDRDVIERLYQVLKLGYVNVLYREGCKPLWYWTVGARKDVFAIVAALFPWMGERRGARFRQALQELPPIRPTRARLS